MWCRKVSVNRVLDLRKYRKFVSTRICHCHERLWSPIKNKVLYRTRRCCGMLLFSVNSITLLTGLGKLSFFTQFLPCDKIEGIILQECIKGHGVNFYLTFMVADQENLAVAFKVSCHPDKFHAIILPLLSVSYFVIRMKDIYPGLKALQRIYTVCTTFLPSVTQAKRSRPK